MGSAYDAAQIASLQNSAAVAKGQLVTFATEGKVGPCGATSDQIVGVYDHRDNDDVAADNIRALPIVVQGKAQCFAGAAVGAGDLLVCSTAKGYKGLAAPLSGLSLSAGEGAWVLGIALADAQRDQAVEVLVQPYYYVKGSN